MTRLGPVIKVTSPVRGRPSEKKIRTRASFKNKPTNYVSEESEINIVYVKKNYTRLSFRKGQESVRRETTESFIEFIGHQMPPHEQND